MGTASFLITGNLAIFHPTPFPKGDTHLKCHWAEQSHRLAVGQPHPRDGSRQRGSWEGRLRCRGSSHGLRGTVGRGHKAQR